MSWWNSLTSIFNNGEREKQKQFIETYQWSAAIRDRFARQHQQLTANQQEQVWEALRDYFAICHGARGATVAMPSRVVDDAWHTFLLFTREYSDFCRNAFGRYFHHAPHELSQSLGPLNHASSALLITRAKELQLAWRLACKREHLDPNATDRLPRLFAIDSDLNIKDGFIHDLRALRRQSADGTGSSCSSGGCSGSSNTSSNGNCGTGNDSGSCGDGAGGSSSDGGGSSCGGSSCGGGCGGGGD